MPTAGSGSSISSSAATRRSTPAICSSEGRWKSKRWQRSTIVAGTLCASVVASTKTTCGGRLLERLQERVPGRRREHVRLVEDVDAPPALIGASATFSRSSRMSSTELFEAASISTTSSEVPARIALAVGVVGVEVHPRPAGRVQRAGQQLGHRGLARAARAHEQVGVVDLVQLDRVAERADDVLLADHLVEGAWGGGGGRGRACGDPC